MINENNEENDRKFVEKFSSDCNNINDDCKLTGVLPLDKSLEQLQKIKECLIRMQESVDEQIEKTNERINKKF